MAHVDGGDGLGPLARGKVVEAGSPLSHWRRHGSVQEVPRDEPLIDAPVRDVMSLWTTFESRRERAGGKSGFCCVGAGGSGGSTAKSLESRGAPQSAGRCRGVRAFSDGPCCRFI